MMRETSGRFHAVLLETTVHGTTDSAPNAVGDA